MNITYIYIGDSTIKFHFLKLKIFYLLPILFLLLFCKEETNYEKDFVIYQVNPKHQTVQFFWKNDKSEILKNFENLIKYTESKQEKLIFAMNGGMFEPNNSPKGLYIENFNTLIKVDTLNGNGNFYVQPNGIFYLTKNNEAKIIETKKFKAIVKSK